MAAIDLTQDLLPLAVCVRVERSDGVVLGFTSHDRVLSIGGVDYEASDSVSATAIRQQAGTGVDNLDIEGILSSDKITETDLRAGLFDNAAIRIFLVDWSNLALDAIKVVKGNIGDVGIKDGQYSAEVRSLSQRLNQQIGELTSPTCRVKQLGDDRCKVSLAGFQFTRTVASVTSGLVLTFGADIHASAYYTYGRVIFTSGDNDGLQREIRTHVLSGGQAVITLQEAFPFVVSPGDTATLEAGCDRTLASCRDKFSNTINYRGEPAVPGNDYLYKINGTPK